MKACKREKNSVSINCVSFFIIFLNTLAWDQSDKFMKIYVTIKGVHALPKERVTCEFGKRYDE